MRNQLLPIALGLCTLLPASLAAAEGSARTSGSPEVSYDFEDDLVAGDLAFPMGERLLGRGRVGRRNLIRTREHFVPEMMETVEDL